MLPPGLLYIRHGNRRGPPPAGARPAPPSCFPPLPREILCPAPLIQSLMTPCLALQQLRKERCAASLPPTPRNARARAARRAGPAAPGRPPPPLEAAPARRGARRPRAPAHVHLRVRGAGSALPPTARGARGGRGPPACAARPVPRGAPPRAPRLAPAALTAAPVARRGSCKPLDPPPPRAGRASRAREATRRPDVHNPAPRPAPPPLRRGSIPVPLPPSTRRSVARSGPQQRRNGVVPLQQPGWRVQHAAAARRRVPPHASRQQRREG
jgi:hypothetical protein